MYGIGKLKAFIALFENRIQIKRHNVSLDKSVRINGRVYFCGSGQIEIGSYVRINSGIQFNPIGGADRCILNTREHGIIRIGEHCGISNSTIVAEECVEIGNYVFIGGNCKIYDTDFHSVKFDNRIQVPDSNMQTMPIRIKDGAFIGAHSLILKGVTIGSRSVIGAGSVVTKDIPDNQLWAGNPARFIRSIE